MGKKAKHPEGAITSRRALATLVEQAHSGQEVKIYSINFVRKRIFRRILNKDCFLTGKNLHYINQDGRKRVVKLSARTISSKRGVQVRGYFFTNFFLAMAYASRIGAVEAGRQ